MGDGKSNDSDWLSSKEVASRIHVDERTVRRWCEKGKVEARLTPSDKNWRIKVDADGFPVRR